MPNINFWSRGLLSNLGDGRNVLAAAATVIFKKKKKKKKNGYILTFNIFCLICCDLIVRRAKDLVNEIELNPL